MADNYCLPNMHILPSHFRIGPTDLRFLFPWNVRGLLAASWALSQAASASRCPQGPEVSRPWDGSH